MLGGLIAGAIEGGAKGMNELADMALKRAEEAKKNAAAAGLIELKFARDMQLQGIDNDRDDTRELNRQRFQAEENEKNRKNYLDRETIRNNRPGGASGARNGINALQREIDNLRKLQEDTFDEALKAQLQERIDTLESRFDSMIDMDMDSGPAEGNGVRKLPPVGSMKPTDPGPIDYTKFKPKPIK